MRVVVLRHHNQSAGLFIQTMYNPRPQRASHPRQTSQMMQQGIHQRSAIARIVGRSRPGVNHHSGRLVDHREIVIFINNVERNILGDGLDRSPLRFAQHADPLPATQLQRGLRWKIVDEHFAFGDHLLHTGATHGFKACREELI